MSFASGTRIGPYEVVGPLGAGGMGEVYRATDTDLKRPVALKVLPASLANDAERVARFQREAEVLAALNHPHIAQIYGLARAGSVTALVMELVDGEDLSVRLMRGRLPLDDAWAVARQIAEALEAAHDRGIVHRDLKPSNVKVRPDGTVKVLDFGLARSIERDMPQTAPGDSPTVTSPAMTTPGVILGTAAYMAPEQARGRPVDRRADVWALGAVLFEMLAGQRAFRADDTTDTIVAVLSRDPDWTALPADTPASIRRLLQRCLQKDPKNRLDSAAAVRLDVEEASRVVSGTSTDDAVRADPLRPTRGWLRPVLGATAAALVGAGLVGLFVRPQPQPETPATRFGIALAPAHALAHSINDRDLVVSADGRMLVYTAGGDARLMVRAFDQLAAQPLSGIADARAPFLSPDGRWVGFFNRQDEGQNVGTVSAGTLRKASLAGGPPIAVCRLVGSSRGATWAEDDTIVFATNDPSTGLLRVAASGGEAAVLTTPDRSTEELDHYFPSALPGGRAVLFTITSAGSRRQVAVLDLASGERRILVRDGSQAEYVDTGHLVYVAEGTLWAVQFDLASLTTRGDPVPVLDDLIQRAAANFSVSRQGTLVYAPRPVRDRGELSLNWIDRSGREQPLAAPLRRYSYPRVSPDGRRIVVRVAETAEPESNLWIYHLEHQTLTRLTPATPTYLAIWAPDGRSIVFNGRDRGDFLFRRPADGSGSDEPLLDGKGFARIPSSVSPDGSRLVYHEYRGAPDAAPDLLALRLDGSRRDEPLLYTPADERNGEISPDGRWLAYDSTVSGRVEVYVRPFPNVNDGLFPISTDGGRTPVWSPSGRELFFVSGTKLMAASIGTTAVFAAARSVVLFDNPSLLLDARAFTSGAHRVYDVSRDGQRFLVLKDGSRGPDADEGAPSMVVVQNWLGELKRLAPMP